MSKLNLKLDNEYDYLCDEAFNSLRTNILFYGYDTKIISVTSCIAHDGKSTVTFELARRLASIGKKVLIIDADMRKSRFVAKRTDETTLFGLSQFLSGQKALEDVLFETNVENLSVVVAGVCPPNPSELLTNKLFSEFLANSREEFDFVLIDTPPIGLVSDAAICVSKSDGALLVISSEKTKMRDAHDAKKSIESVGTRLIGCVLNNVKMMGKKHYYHYY